MKVFFNDAFEEWYVADSVEDAHAAWLARQNELACRRTFGVTLVAADLQAAVTNATNTRRFG